MAAETPRQQSPAAVRRRAERLTAKREEVLRATIDLIEEGDLNPTIPKIVERSGTPERSIFRYFTDIGDLTQQVVGLAVRDLAGLERIDELGVGTFDERVEALVTVRLRLLERVQHLGHVARLRVLLSPSIDEALNDTLLRLRDQVDKQFSPELDELAAEERELTIDSIAMTVSFENFDCRKRRLGHDLDEIAAGWRHAIRRFLV